MDFFFVVATDLDGKVWVVAKPNGAPMDLHEARIAREKALADNDVVSAEIAEWHTVD